MEEKWRGRGERQGDGKEKGMILERKGGRGCKEEGREGHGRYIERRKKGL